MIIFMVIGIVYFVKIVKSGFFLSCGLRIDGLVFYKGMFCDIMVKYINE